MHNRSLQSIAGVRAVLHSLALPPAAPIEILDIGANPIDGDPPYLPLLAAGLARVTGFEPQHEALQRLQQQAGPHERYLPYALGDGGTHELVICTASGFSSILEPDPAQLELLVDFPRLAQVIDRRTVATQRLDDLSDIERVDFVKIDVQGAESVIIEHGRRALADVLAVQIEVNYHRLYVGQPTAGQVDAQLRGLGLVPHRVVATKTWPLAPTPWSDPDQEEAHHLVEADLLYVRDPAHLADLHDAQLLALARCAGLAYGSFGLARSCLAELLARGSVMLEE